MTQFEETLQKLKPGIPALRAKCRSMGNYRLLAVLAALACVALAVFFRRALPLIPAGLLIGVFAVLVVRHARLEDRLGDLEQHVAVNGQYLARIRLDWDALPDTGREFCDEAHPYTGDLDIFGRHSLYQLISCCRLKTGREALARALSGPEPDAAALRAVQEAVSELAANVDFCVDYQCNVRLKGDLPDVAERLARAMREDGGAPGRPLARWLHAALPAAALGSLGLALAGFPMPPWLPAGLLSLNLLLIIFGRRYRKTVREMAGLHLGLEAFEALTDLIERSDFSSPLLRSLSAVLLEGEASMKSAGKKLKRVAAAVDVRTNGLVHFVLNVALLWDYHCAHAIDAWKARHGVQVGEWMEVFGRFEAYISLAVPSQVSGETCTPVVTQGPPLVEAAGLGHPLIARDRRVTNDITLDRQSCIVTGSNMSGKTTMLRTVGTALVLAYAGASVPARRMRCSFMSVCTSMRIADDLSGGISTFYAELLRIKGIVARSERGDNVFFLLDEIFRGTNSVDRVIGAKSVIARLCRPWSIGMVSTHDFELCALEAELPGKIRNFHFTEHYVGDDIRFDYKMRAGRCTTSNARHLMRLAGIDTED